jgi:TRAP-type C4-dicarboxylate transport system permease large subunit
MPALVCTILLMLTVFVVAIIHKHPRADRRAAAGEMACAFLPAFPAIAGWA